LAGFSYSERAGLTWHRILAKYQPMNQKIGLSYEFTGADYGVDDIDVESSVSQLMNRKKEVAKTRVEFLYRKSPNWINETDDPARLLNSLRKTVINQRRMHPCPRNASNSEKQKNLKLSDSKLLHANVSSRNPKDLVGISST
jgi:hypothetical protein